MKLNDLKDIFPLTDIFYRLVEKSINTDDLSYQKCSVIMVTTK